MEREIAFRLAESHRGANYRRALSEAHPMSAINVAILMLGCLSIAAAYMLNSMPRETLVRALPNTVVIESR
jgi:hypothetical protein